jgi:hypothetical protein
MADIAIPPPAAGGFKRVLGKLDMTLFTVCAVLVVDTLAASALIGPSSLTWWLITLVVFFVPYGLMTAELGAAYPGEGGIQQWIQRAFGDRWAGRIAWYYWINVALWMPSAYILFAGMFAQLFWPDMSLWAKIALCVGHGRHRHSQHGYLEMGAQHRRTHQGSHHAADRRGRHRLLAAERIGERDHMGNAYPRLVGRAQLPAYHRLQFPWLRTHVRRRC